MLGYVISVAVLLLFAVLVLLCLFALRKRATGYAGAAGMLGDETVAAPPPSQAVGLEAGASVASARATDFDLAAFLQDAKLRFIHAQAAGAPEMRGQRRDLTTLRADLLELTAEAGTYRASVRFSGLMHRRPDGDPGAFQEVWNLAKPPRSAEWLLAGIQQMH